MPLFKRQPPSRGELLAQASAALGKGRKRKAMRLYLQVLELEPDNLELHGRIAPLLAEQGRSAEAWESYQRAAEHHSEKGFSAKALSVYRQAAEKLPRTVEIWERIASLQSELQHPGEAFRTLESACKHFGWRRWRQRMRLIEGMHLLQPDNVQVACRYARLLVRAGQRRRALELLSELEPRLERRGLRRVRGVAVRLAPSPGTGWRWLRAVVAGR